MPIVYAGALASDAEKECGVIDLTMLGDKLPTSIGASIFLQAKRNADPLASPESEMEVSVGGNFNGELRASHPERKYGGNEVTLLVRITP